MAKKNEALGMTAFALIVIGVFMLGINDLTETGRFVATSCLGSAMMIAGYITIWQR